MELDKIFDLFCATHGLGSRYEQATREYRWFVALIEQVRYRGTKSANALFTQFGRLPVHVDIADNRSFNAFAAISRGVNLVGITTTAIRCLYPLAGAIGRYWEAGSSPEPAIKGYFKETDWIEPASVDSCCDRILKFGPLVPKEAEERHSQFFWMLVHLVFHHEFAHLYMGHVGFLEHGLSVASVSERPAIQHPDQELWHAMEIDADIGMCMRILSLPASELELALATSMVLFSLLYRLAPEHTNSHPHPLVRQHALINRVGNESGINDADFNRLLDRIKDRWSKFGFSFFEALSNRTQMGSAPGSARARSNGDAVSPKVCTL